MLALALAAAAAIYPSGPSVPENLLRIELRFELPRHAPLDIGSVRLLDAEGQAIPGVFLDMTLPSADGRRVTLLLHPGRVKTGVGANLALGRALHAGEAVTLAVDEGAMHLRKTWHVGAFDADSPRLDQWQFAQPARGSKAPMTIRLDRPLSAWAEDLIVIRGPDGKRVAGRARLEDGETLWRFTPARRWRPGAYAIVTHPELETPAGNRVCGAFEGSEKPPEVCETERVFVVGLR